jgi:hypothetical protein
MVVLEDVICNYLVNGVKPQEGKKRREFYCEFYGHLDNYKLIFLT